MIQSCERCGGSDLDFDAVDTPGGGWRLAECRRCALRWTEPLATGNWRGVPPARARRRAAAANPLAA